MTMYVHGYATHSATSELVPFTFERRDPAPAMLQSTSFTAASVTPTSTPARNEWGWTQYPFVPGHEIIGRVAAIGNKV